MNELFSAVLQILFLLWWFVLTFGVFRKRPNCPDCEAGLPMFVSPLTKTRRQWLEGGWVCPNCNIDVDANGFKAEMPYVANWRRIWPQFTVLVVLGGIGIVLCISLQTKRSVEEVPPDPLRIAMVD